MPSSPAQPSFVCDSAALYEILKCEDSSKLVQLKKLMEAGVIRVPTYVWQEFIAVYESEASLFEAWSIHKMPCDEAVDVTIALLVEASGLGYEFTPHPNADLVAAGVACAGGLVLLTSERRLSFYEDIVYVNTADVMTLELEAIISAALA